MNDIVNKLYIYIYFSQLCIITPQQYTKVYDFIPQIPAFTTFTQLRGMRGEKSKKKGEQWLCKLRLSFLRVRGWVCVCVCYVEHIVFVCFSILVCTKDIMKLYTNIKMHIVYLKS